MPSATNQSSVLFYSHCTLYTPRLSITQHSTGEQSGAQSGHRKEENEPKEVEMEYFKVQVKIVCGRGLPAKDAMGKAGLAG